MSRVFPAGQNELGEPPANLVAAAGLFFPLSDAEFDLVRFMGAIGEGDVHLCSLSFR